MMFPYTTSGNLFLVVLIETKQAKHSYSVLSLNITAENWSDTITNNKTLVSNVYILLLKLGL